MPNLFFFSIAKLSLFFLPFYLARTDTCYADHYLLQSTGFLLDSLRLVLFFAKLLPQGREWTRQLAVAGALGRNVIPGLMQKSVVSLNNNKTK